jgi:hypothetical protein
VSEVKIAWGMDASRVMRHISEVEKGKACNCICPNIGCATPLIAKKGDNNANHFSHQSNITCSGESALHLAAKQIIEDAAKDCLKLTLPAIEGYVAEKDLLSMLNEERETVNPTFLLREAIQESRITPYLIADVMAFSQSSEELAIEIFVSNAKDELSINKYESCQKESIEIDLSSLPWNINREELKKAVLQTAPRVWLFSTRTAELEKALQIKLERRLDVVNSRYFTELNEASRGIREGFNTPNISWETLSLEVTEKGPGSTSAKVTRTPKAKRFGRSWIHQPYGYSGFAILKNNVELEALITLSGAQHLIAMGKEPKLILTSSYSLEGDELSEHFTAKWINIEKWHNKLDLLASRALRKRITDKVAKQQQLDEFTLVFKNTSLEEKMNILCKVLSLTPPATPSKISEHWNTSWNVWKTLVWRYRIFEKEGEFLECREIAKDPWFQKLLDFCTERQARDNRERNLSYWFYSLHKLGYLNRLSRDFYTVSSKDNKSFQPWKYLK